MATPFMYKGVDLRLPNQSLGTMVAPPEVTSARKDWLSDVYAQQQGMPRTIQPQTASPQDEFNFLSGAGSPYPIGQDPLRDKVKLPFGNQQTLDVSKGIGNIPESTFSTHYNAPKAPGFSWNKLGGLGMTLGMIAAPIALASMGVGGAMTGAGAAAGAGTGSIFADMATMAPAYGATGTGAGTAGAVGAGSIFSDMATMSPVLTSPGAAGGTGMATGLKGILTNPYFLGSQALGAGFNYLGNRQQGDRAEETSRAIMDLISQGNVQQQQGYTQQREDIQKAYLDAIGRQDKYWGGTYQPAYEKAVEAATPNIPAYTTALQGIISEQIAAGKRKAGETASLRGTGGGAYGREAERLQREGRESIARSLLPMYSGYNIPLPAVQPTIMPQIPGMPPQQQIPSYDVMSGLTGAGGSNIYNQLGGLLGTGGTTAMNLAVLNAIYGNKGVK